MRCKYCGSPSVLEFCNEKCGMEYAEFQKYAEKYVKLFLVGMLGPALLMMFSIAFIDYILFSFGILIFIMGIVLIVFPFVTPETVSKFGLKKGIWIGRWCGCLLLLIGVIFIVAFLLVE